MSYLSNHIHLEATLCNEHLENELKSLTSSNINSALEITNPDTNPSISMFNKDDATFPDSACNSNSVKDYLDIFFKDMDFQNDDFSKISTSSKEQLSDISHDSDGKHSIVSNNPCMMDSRKIISRTKGTRSLNSTVFQKELTNFMFLSLKFHNREYYIHIREFKWDKNTIEKIPTKNRVVMDRNTWYEFQYKMYAFNLRYKSSSFIANNIVLVLNVSNSTMHIKNLKNFSSIDLSEYQFQKLKEMSYVLNKKLIQHMYTVHLPFLIKQKCTIAHNLSAEKELAILSKLYFYLEENILSIINRIYECHACIQLVKSNSLHPCFLFNNREKYQQLGDMILMLVDLQCVTYMFSNGENFISENFLSNLNVGTIRNVLFKTRE